ncbi:hypothetical protein EG328_009663 [Venturia inaequalis]|uniref:Uncharacterized protein n=1 Tax=Venturia inaequalis TaxID=5025 RepID=A0A8H3YQ09_VENIN|nr:hypothetical protein EG328_009663 [Venturia inaequalis]RDI79181.1 hypothetical protein Vi05172_g10808 [Venturia inaequalis]
MRLHSRNLASFNPTCPGGGLWYACGPSSSRFVGCCAQTNDPCSSVGCFPKNLRNTSFERAHYAQFSDGTCPTSQKNEFYTCNKTKPYNYSFMGCCRVNPCNEGCPDGMLDPAALPILSIAWEAYGVSSETASASVSSTTSVSTIVPSPFTSSKTSGKHNIGAIVGGTLGGIAVLILLFLLVGWLISRSRKSRDARKKYELETSKHSPNMSRIHGNENAGK